MTDSYEFGTGRSRGRRDQLTEEEANLTKKEQLEIKKRKEEEYQKLLEEKAKKAVLDERLSNSYEKDGITYDSFTDKPIDADGNFVEGEKIVTPETTSSNNKSSSTVGINTYSKELLEEERAFQALEKRLVSPATVLEGAVYHHFNADGSFAGISQGEPLEGTFQERKDALAARDAANAANTLSKEQQRDLERVSNDPSLVNEILEKSREKTENLDKKIAREDDDYDYNNAEPFEGGTEVKNDAPKMKVQYPYNWVQQTSAGHRIEMNNTKGAERVRILNGNGNFLDMDELKNNSLVSYNDTYILSDHNLVIKIGKDVETDRMALHVIGDVNIYVEGNMHSEVEGDRFDRVNGNYQMQVGGVCTIQSDENLAIQAKNEMKLQSNAYTNKTTFLENDLSEGGSVKENVKGNYEVKILKESSTFSINSDGDVRTRAAGCRYEKVDGNLLTQVGGKVFTKVDGGSKSCINGGAFDGMISSPDSNAYKLDVTGNIKGDATGNVDVDAGGNIDLDASAIYLN